MKNKKIVIAIISIVLVVGCLGAFYFFSRPKNTVGITPEVTSLPESGNQSKPEETTTGITVDYIDHNTYKVEDLDFKFAIVKIRLKSDSPINYSLAHIKTSEQISLGDVNDYVTKLEEKQYYLGKQNVFYELISNDTTLIANIFVPIKDVNAKSITLTVDDNKDIVLDVSKTNGDANSLKYEANDIITDGKEYQMQVSAAYAVSTTSLFTVVGGEQMEYMAPSTIQIYAMDIEAVSLWGDTIEITDAIYLPENSDEQFVALDSSVRSVVIENIIGQKISDKSKGALFFEVYDPIDNPITYKGILKLKVNGQDNWIVVNVDLN